MSGTLHLEGVARIGITWEALRPTLTARFTVRHGNTTAEGTDMAYTLPVDHFITVNVTYQDSAGNPAQVDGPVVWTSSNDAVLAVTDNADGSCNATPSGQLGAAQVVATADADIGAGTTTLITTMDVQIVAGEAVAGVISVVGDPQPKP